MITVIVPTLNEEETIANVVKFAKNTPNVSEVIVVDDKSADHTVAIAKESGAKIITSTKLGKGASMKDALSFASNDVLVFLDGDIDPYPEGTIPLLTNPILNNEADFVKSCFDRNSGRVTELVAKPLLSILFPELTHFSQPLSGMIAGRKSMFQKIDFREDYGVDIGILIDMYLMEAKIKEVDIGYIENRNQSWQALGRMSKEVAQTIIYKASKCKNPNLNFEELGVLHEIRSQMEFALENELKQLSRLVIFDMDNTLLLGRFVDIFAKTYGMKDALMNIRLHEKDPVVITKKIAHLLKGKTLGEITLLADNIPIVEDAAEVIKELKRNGFIVGIISDSYDCVTTHIKNKLGMDFALANELEFSKSICTGEVKIPSFLMNSDKSICKHTFCKTNAMLSVLEKYKIDIKNCIAIGDSINDLCMLREAGIGIAFCSPDELVNHYADIIIEEKSFSKILELPNVSKVAEPAAGKEKSSVISVFKRIKRLFVK